MAWARRKYKMKIYEYNPFPEIGAYVISPKLRQKQPARPSKLTKLVIFRIFKD